MSNRKVRIEVVQDDIAEGKPGDPCGCMLALAISRAMGEPWQVGFTFADHEVQGENESMVQLRRADLPDEACQARASFDDGDPVLPFEFELEVEELQP